MKALIVTDKGLKRSNNEDSVLFITSSESVLFTDSPNSTAIKELEGPFIIIVSDGMGGYGGGELASKLVCNTYQKNFRIESNPENYLKSIFKEVNKEILQLSIEKQEYKNMGATIAGLYFTNESYYTFHAGDSRVYHFHGKYLRQLTADHSLSNITSADSGSQSRALTNCVAGGTEDNFLEVKKINSSLFEGNDKILISSDGVHEFIDIEILEDILSEKVLENIQDRLIAEIQKAGAPDNFSFILIQG